MRTLGIDTATWTATVGIVDGERTLAERTLPATRSHAHALLSLIDEALVDAGLALADIALVAVSIGPGSFTGVRIGLGVAKGISLTTGAAVVGVPTLEGLAHASRALEDRTVYPVLDARKGEIYAAEYKSTSSGMECVRTAFVLTPSAFVRGLGTPSLLIGSGASLCKAHLIHRRDVVVDDSVIPKGTVVARLGEGSFRARGSILTDTLEPVYVRASDAELSFGRKD